ncbi:hypothetical protein HanRHA438_Chr12g0546371 [Helianthus annuus]|nr:hypothetical protein HanPSC8_Chr15g0681601 [Helianthus annuus]KAJ0865957.1 hypothetical protein HanRHA438_Chr12g0546371 [Helianthus annuus]
MQRITEWKVKVLYESRRITEAWRSKTESQVRLYGNAWIANLVNIVYVFIL